MTKRQMAEKIYFLEEQNGTQHEQDKDSYIKSLTAKNTAEQLRMSLDELEVFSDITTKHNRIYGYCRVSTKTQSIDRQIRNILKEYPNADIRQEAFTGTKIDGRTEFIKLLKEVCAGDTIVFDSVSRMSRNAAEGIEMYFKLYSQGINLVFLKEGYINTEVFESTSKQMIPTTGNDIADIYIDATNKVIRLLAEKQIAKAFEQAQKEVDDNHQRTAEGIETARRNGKQIGRKKGKTNAIRKDGTVSKQAESEKAIREAILKKASCFGGAMNDNDCMKVLGISRGTYYKYKKQLMEEIESDQENALAEVINQ